MLELFIEIFNNLEVSKNKQLYCLVLRKNFREYVYKIGLTNKIFYFFLLKITKDKTMYVRYGFEKIIINMVSHVADKK